LEAYLLLLFGFLLFKYYQKDNVDKVLLLSIADADDNHIPVFI
jgi:hypothetical protein